MIISSENELAPHYHGGRWITREKTHLTHGGNEGKTIRDLIEFSD